MISSCPVCNGIKYKIIGAPVYNSVSINFKQNEYIVVQCLNCSAYFVSPPINFTDEQWSMLYNSEYFSNQSKWLIKKRAAELKQRLDKAFHFLNEKTDIKFLDIGAGEGKTLIEGIKRNWDVTAIDIVDNRIDAAKGNNIKFIQSKFMEFDFPENHYDFIYLDSVLEHVLNPKDYLLKIKNILKPGGIVYIGVPNEDSLFNYIKRIVFNFIGRKKISEKIKPFDTPYHVIGFNNKSLKFIFNHLGFEIKSFRNFGRKFDFLGHKPNQRGFWIGLLFLLPVEFIGKLINKDVYFDAFISKKK